MQNLVKKSLNCLVKMSKFFFLFIQGFQEALSSGLLILSNCSKLKELAGDNFKFDENGRKFFIRVENTVGKGGIA